MRNTPMEPGSITLLIIEDDKIDQMVIRRFIDDNHLPYEYTIVGSVSEATAALQSDQFDIALLDYMLGDGTAFDLFETIQGTPFIIVTGTGDEELAVRAMKAGAYDYLIKDNLGNYTKTLPVTVEKALERKRTEEALQRYQNHLEELVKERTVELEKEIREREQAEQVVRQLNAELELRVEERTEELRQANQELQISLETLRTTQEQLVQSKKMASLGGLVAGIAHEINTPVGVGVTAASYLEEQTAEFIDLYHEHQMKRSDLEHYLHIADESSGMILTNLQLAARHIQIFKQVAVDQTNLEKRRFHLKEYLDDVFISLRPEIKPTQHVIVFQCPEALILESYPGAFSQIITNFVMNSLVHGFEHKSHGKILLEVTTAHKTITLRYSDNGKGMNQEECSKIFEPFYTTRRGQGGSGLGLHIVYNLVTQKFKGSIECQSAPGLGTVFIIQIPLEEGDA